MMNVKFPQRTLCTRAGWGLAWRIALLTVSHCLVSSVCAESPAWRYLLVVETSKAMQTRQEASAKAVRELLENQVRAEAGPRDSLGVWTFNSELRTGQLPLQHFGSGNASEIAAKVSQFVRAQTNEHTPKLERATEPLKALVERSQGLTVILLTSGLPISGTPFDEQINAITGRWRNYQESKGLPFVTVLRAQQGAFVDFSVTPVPWPLSWPWPPRGQSQAVEETGAGSAQPMRAEPGSRAVRSPKAGTAPLILSGRRQTESFEDKETRTGKAQSIAQEEAAAFESPQALGAARQTTNAHSAEPKAALTTETGSNTASPPLAPVEAASPGSSVQRQHPALRGEPTKSASEAASEPPAQKAPVPPAKATNISAEELPPASHQHKEPVTTPPEFVSTALGSQIATNLDESAQQSIPDALRPEAPPPPTPGAASGKTDLSPSALSNHRPSKPSMATTPSGPETFNSTAEMNTGSPQTFAASESGGEQDASTKAARPFAQWRWIGSLAFLGGVLTLLWLLKSAAARKRPHRPSIITQSLERHEGMETVPAGHTPGQLASQNAKQTYG